MNAYRGLKLAVAILVLSAPIASLAAPAFAETSGSQSGTTVEVSGTAVLQAAGRGSATSEGPQPTSTEQSEADKQAAEKAREAAKQAKEAAKEAAKQAAEKAKEAAKKAAKSQKVASGQLQLPPLVIRPATPEDNLLNENDDNNVSPTATPAATADPNGTASVAGLGTKKFAKKPSTTTGQSTSDGTASGATLSSDGSTGGSKTAKTGQQTYVVSPLSKNSDGSSTTAQNEFVKIADPTSNDPIRLVSEATLKTPADQFFEFAGWSILALGGGTAAMLGWGVYRGIRLRRAEAFDFEYRA